MHLTSNNLPLGLDDIWGLAESCRIELRSQGSKPGKLLEQSIYTQYPQAFLKLYRAKNKSVTLTKMVHLTCREALCTRRTVSLSFLGLTFGASWCISFDFRDTIPVGILFTYREDSILYIPNLLSTLVVGL